ncbi:MAG: prolyl oligopeptidase family serine peptidase [Brumimicrobium sp.]
MKRIIIPVILSLAILACNNNTKEEVEVMKEIELGNYPETKKGDVVDEYFGEEVADPYRWLEDDMSEETAAWVKAQNEVTFGYLNQIPYKNKIADKLNEIWNYEKIGSPFVRGNYTYFYKNDGLQNQFVIYRYKNGNDSETAEVFIDPNTFSEAGTTSLDALSFTESGKLVAYSISEGGSDWRKVIVLDAETKEQIGDTIIDVKFSGISWYKEEGFYYSSYDKPEGSELSEKTDQHKLYYHQLATPQSSDKVIFGGKQSEKHRYIGGEVTDDNKYLIITANISTYGNKLFVKDLENPNAPLVTVVSDNTSSTDILDNDGSTLYLITDRDAPNKRVVTVDLKNPSPENWTDLIPETNNVLTVSTAGEYFFAHYMIDATSSVKQINKKGEIVREIELPGIGTANGFRAKAEETETYFSFSNYITPGNIYKLNLETGDSELYFQPNISFNPEDYETKQIFYQSKDGTEVPMIISHKKGIELDGTNPSMLYAYGGFNISLTPSFSVVNAIWMEMGGVYAVPNLRGGGEYGKEWHDAGTQMRKQNVFDDFIAAAEYLIKNKYTSNEKLAISGGSNGGLLVGATMTQRPDLMKVALPAVGVLDMLRYHTFTAGAGWAYDYGTSEDSKEMFDYLKGYSPVHNVKEGIEYPATLVTTGDHDDRVVPAHSYKFVAELQAKQTGNNPTLIRIEVDAGHGAGTPVSKIIEQRADIFAFTLWNLGVRNL